MKDCTHDRPVVFLAHRATEGGYRANLERLRRLAAGAELAYPRLRFVRALGRTPDDDPLGSPPTPDRLLNYARRLILGDGEPPAGPAATRVCHGRVDQLWALGLPALDLARQVAWAEEAGIPVCQPGPEVEIRLLEAGLVAELARGRRWGGAANGLDGEEARPWTPRRVVLAFASGMQAALGVRAIDYAAVRSGAYHCAMAAIDRQSEQLARAAAIVRLARRQGLTERHMALLCALWGDGHTLVDAGRLAGLGGGTAEAVEQRARRARARAEGILRRVLAEVGQAEGRAAA